MEGNKLVQGLKLDIKSIKKKKGNLEVKDLGQKLHRQDSLRDSQVPKTR